MEKREKLHKLKDILRDMESVVIGFSGGVDSTFLLKVAKEVLEDRVLAVTASSYMFSQREFKEAMDFAKDIEANHIVLKIEKLENEEIAKNPKDRCYHCKKELFSKILDMAREKGYKYVVDGANSDDMGDYRPGMTAARELGIRSPLLEAGFTKEDIRALSREMNLQTWDKPSYACLASRIPYGQEITKEKLRMVEESEQFLLDLGLRQVRIRHHGDIARIEVSPGEMEKLFSLDMMDRIGNRLKEIGFSYASLDLKGYRTGSMNEVLTREE